MKFYYVYILKCLDNTYYVGFTSNLDKRIIEHNAGLHKDSYTFKRRPVELVWYQEFSEPNQAIYFEKKIKKWSKAKKEALISDNFDLLPLLAACKNETHFSNKSLDSARPDNDIE